MNNYIWVDTQEQLAELCQNWLNLEELALDTEFIRTSTFHPVPALLQINDGHQNYLLDIPVLGTPECLLNLMVSGPVKVLHSCSEDLEVFQHWLSVLPYPLVDTQLAAALVTQDTAFGYQRLVQEYLGIELDKGETRSNWLQRPLTDAQLNYAAQDVEHLLKVWQQLKEQLQAKNLLEILYAESNWLLEEAVSAYPEDAWQRCKQAWRLTARELAVLQSLSLWRERQAQEKNKPRSRVIQDNQLMLLAERLPHSLDDLSRLGEFSPRWIDQFGASLLAELVPAANLPAELWPTPLTSPRHPNYKKARQLLKSGLENLASQLEVPIDFLTKRKQQEEWTQALSQHQLPEVPENWPAWRRIPLEKLIHQIYQQVLT